MQDASSVAVRTHLPCDRCGSSDARAEYADGHDYCFACGTPGKAKPKKRVKVISTPEAPVPLDNPTLGNTLGNNNNPRGSIYPLVGSTTLGNNVGTKLENSSPPEKIIFTVSHRGLKPEVLTKFGISSSKWGLVFDYGKAAKVRNDDRSFRTFGPYRDAPLFGQQLWEAGSAKAITITEGELDAASVYQMMGDYPVVSVKSGTSAKRDVGASRDYVNSFEKIYLCFDNDAVGQKASLEVAALFNPNKVFIVSLNKFKDANEYLTAGSERDFKAAWWAAKRYRPKGILSGYDEISGVLSQESSKPVATFPFETLDKMLCGVSLGQVHLFTAPEKIGKTEVMRAIEHHLLKTTDFNLGVIHLEEKERRAIQGLIGYQLKTHVHRPDSQVSLEDQLKAYKDLTRRDDRVVFYQHFGSEDPDVILDILRHMVTVQDCKFIFLDHITMLVTGFEGDDERKKLDYLSTQFAMLTRELNFTLFLVSHVNDDGKTRGSRNISKIASSIIHLSRDIESADSEVRNTVSLMVKGNRDGSETGPAGKLYFNRETFTLNEITTESGILHTTPQNEAKALAQSPVVEVAAM